MLDSKLWDAANSMGALENRKALLSVPSFIHYHIIMAIVCLSETKVSQELSSNAISRWVINLFKCFNRSSLLRLVEISFFSWTDIMFVVYFCQYEQNQTWTWIWFYFSRWYLHKNKMERFAWRESFFTINCIQPGFIPVGILQQWIPTFMSYSFHE